MSREHRLTELQLLTDDSRVLELVGRIVDVTFTLHWDGPISARAERRGLDRPLDLAPWLELHEPETVLC
ncbi:hypothetical protein [Streptomyces sp. NBC_00459]|uniref:hypothetical protein n=1 Tax=Streptomyces sp. NBC_00459 TaxID=2975749 RepID=UPI002E1753E6